jgi:hypothetical protein
MPQVDSNHQKTEGELFMPQFKVAHIREQGNGMIIAPLNSSFGSHGARDQSAFIFELENRAHAAGLAGSIAVVWDSGGGLMRFIAPRPWAPFFRSIDLDWVRSNINKTIYW